MAFGSNAATDLNFSGVEVDEVFSSGGIIPILRKYDNFLEMYVNDPNTAAPLPPKITRDRVVDNSIVRRSPMGGLQSSAFAGCIRMRRFASWRGHCRACS